MDRRTRICLWIILLGLVNFLAYAIVYEFIGGDAMNGFVRAENAGAGPLVRHYWLSCNGQPIEVSRAVWVYSAVHSISIWVTVGAVLLAMLTLAKDRIVSSMRAAVIRGRTMITVIATLISVICVIMATHFILLMIRNLTSPEVVQAVTNGMR
jgi:hypothetical protein